MEVQRRGEFGVWSRTASEGYQLNCRVNGLPCYSKCKVGVGTLTIMRYQVSSPTSSPGIFASTSSNSFVRALLVEVIVARPTERVAIDRFGDLVVRSDWYGRKESFF